MNLKGALAVVHFDHDLLSLHHINTYLQESVAAILIVSTDEENGERLVDFGVDPPVSFGIPIITMSHTSGRRLDGHAGKICIGMACDLTSMTQRFKDATGAGEEMATFFCTDALEHGLTWEHAANAYIPNSKQGYHRCAATLDTGTERQRQRHRFLHAGRFGLAAAFDETEKSGV